MDGDVYEVERDARLVFRIRAESQMDAEAKVLMLNDQIGTFMVDQKDWRFVESTEVDGDLVDDIVEIYAEEV